MDARQFQAETTKLPEIHWHTCWIILSGNQTSAIEANHAWKGLLTNTPMTATKLWYWKHYTM